MFTGIIQNIGRVTGIRKTSSGCEFEIQSGSLCQDLTLGASIACNGICLSATEVNNETFKVYAVAETLAKTNLALTEMGSRLNLELAMTPTTRFGGHQVSGHIDAAIPLLEINSLPDGSAEYFFQIPDHLNKYCISKGSVALNGVSLTVAEINEGGIIKIALIPLTLQETNLGMLEPGDEVNLEVDATGKYIENFVRHFLEQPNSSPLGQLLRKS